ncbi:copper chaperone PCu(A)C [Deinococcus sp. UYEF24]
MKSSFLTLMLCAAGLATGQAAAQTAVQSAAQATHSMAGMEMPAKPMTASPAVKALKLVQGWVSAAPPGAEELSAYVVLSNPGRVALTLTGVSTPAAGSAMLMTTARDAAGRESMQMTGAMKIPAGGTLKVLPGQAHLMLRKFGRQPQPGENVAVTLRFSDGSARIFSLPVRKLP